MTTRHDASYWKEEYRKMCEFNKKLRNIDMERLDSIIESAKITNEIIDRKNELLIALKDCISSLGGINSDAVPDSARAAVTKSKGATNEV